MNYWTERVKREQAERRIAALERELGAVNSAHHALSVSRFDMLAYIGRQMSWSGGTFGPGDRTEGVLDHIRKELREIAENPDDLEEWIDVIILALDGAWRRGYSPRRIVGALVEKQHKNMQREWPDWREAEPGKAIEHVREEAQGEAVKAIGDAALHGTGYLQGGKHAPTADVASDPRPEPKKPAVYDPPVRLRDRSSGRYWAALGRGTVPTVQEAHIYRLSEARRCRRLNPNLQMVSVGARTDAGRPA